jgi:hypothetical protein
LTTLKPETIQVEHPKAQGALQEENETIPHYLLTCPSYAHKRWPLYRQARKKKKTLTLQLLLGNLSMTTHLTNYIDAMQWFRHRPSEQPEN